MQTSVFLFCTEWTQRIIHYVSLSTLSGHFSRWTWVSRCLLKQRMTEVAVATGAISRSKLQSNHHHQQINTQFLTGRMPFLSPNQQCQSTEGKISHSVDLLTPSSPGVFQLFLKTLLYFVILCSIYCIVKREIKWKSAPTRHSNTLTCATHVNTLYRSHNSTKLMEKRSEATQTLHAGCS